jgi:hypothetical protein
MGNEYCPLLDEIGGCDHCPYCSETIRMIRINGEDWEEIPDSFEQHCSKKYF